MQDDQRRKLRDFRPEHAADPAALQNQDAVHSGISEKNAISLPDRNAEFVAANKTTVPFFGACSIGNHSIIYTSTPMHTA